LVDRLFPGYDRISVVTFDRYPYVRLELSDNFTLVKNTITNLSVYEGEGACPYDSNASTDDLIAMQSAIDLAIPNGGTCRVSDADGSYHGMDCPAYWIAGDASLCGNTNIGGGLKVAGNVLGGQYPAGYPTPWPVSRESALWVVVLLTDGQANTGYTKDGATTPEIYNDSPGLNTAGQVICPKYTWSSAYLATVGGFLRYCLDQDARPTVDDLKATPAPGAAVFAARHSIGDPRNADPNTAVYDADDYARDMVDFVTNPDSDPVMPGQAALLFTIGLNENYIASRSPYETTNGLPATAETLLRYGAEKGNGVYYSAPSSDQLGEIFLAIANKIATRLSR
jgi:hypothetical protein